MVKKVIVVIGATGNQGIAVCRQFANIDGWTVRGVTRDTTSEKAQALQQLGVETVQADVNDVQSLKKVFTGAMAIFGMTDFWQFMQKPSTIALMQEKSISWNEAHYLQEVQQGENIIDAAAEVVGEGSLQRFVLSTMSDAKKSSKGKYTWVWHFDSKGQYPQYLAQRAEHDPKYGKLLEMTSYTQLGFYLDNWKMDPLTAPQKVCSSRLTGISAYLGRSSLVIMRSQFVVQISIRKRRNRCRSST
jgi:hypothetical protein